tara:strand:+ start:1342 stop:1506 length:165 start_codon:yes stop_codon:yes gene_type:complete
MKNNDKYFHFKGVKEEREAPEQKKKRLQREFLTRYVNYQKFQLSKKKTNNEISL